MTIGMLLRELAITVKHGGAVAFHAEQAEVLSTANTSRTNEANVNELNIASEGKRGLEATPDVFS